MSPLFENYRQLVARTDALCRVIESALGEQITCSAGCSGCCTSITIFPVEAAVLREELSRLPSRRREAILKHVTRQAGNERCPLLFRRRCLLYHARPIICRTHGLPIVYSAGGTLKSDCCPRNLRGTGSTSGAHVVDLDRLNTVLAAVNVLFSAQSGLDADAARLTIAEAVIGHRH